MSTNYYWYPNDWKEGEYRARFINSLLAYARSIQTTSDISMERQMLGDVKESLDLYNRLERVHLGKSSREHSWIAAGTGHYYRRRKDEYLAFIRSGIICNEYNEQVNPETLIKILLRDKGRVPMSSDIVYEDRIYWCVVEFG